MISVDDAIDILADAAPPRDTVEVPLGAARGRVLAERVVADRDFPPADRSAMDGYAVRAADVGSSPAGLTIVGEIPAGRDAAGIAVAPGQAVRVFTGASIPAGADAVAIVEHATEDAECGTVRIDGPVAPGDHIRVRAGDRRRGDTVLEPGSVIGATAIGVLATVGRTRVRVRRAPRIDVLSTGDELVDPASTPAPHQIRESNGPMIAALLAGLGHEAASVRRVGDRPEDLARALSDGLAADLLLVSGGVSVGAYDLVARTLGDLGAETLFHGVAMRPGKPVLAARRGAHLVVGLPGNPLSALVGLAVLVAPALRRMSGVARWEPPAIEAVLRTPIPAASSRETFHPARLAWHDGRLEAERVEVTGSGDMLAVGGADGLLRIAAGTPRLEPGSRARVVVWRG